VYHISYKDLTNVHVYFYHHFISTVFLRHDSALKQPSSGNMTDTIPHQDQQNMYQM